MDLPSLEELVQNAGLFVCGAVAVPVVIAGLYFGVSRGAIDLKAGCEYFFRNPKNMPYNTIRDHYWCKFLQGPTFLDDPDASLSKPSR